MKAVFKDDADDLNCRQAPKKKTTTTNLLRASPRPWIDGLNGIIRIRSTALPQLQAWFSARSTDNNLTLQFNDVLQNLNQVNFSKTYIFDTTEVTPFPAEVVFSKVYPKNPLKFLLHLLYTMGNFDTEIDLFSYELQKLTK